MINYLVFYQTKNFGIKRRNILKVMNFVIFTDFLRTFLNFFQIYFK